jgi:hypothetical protein
MSQKISNLFSSPPSHLSEVRITLHEVLRIATTRGLVETGLCYYNSSSRAHSLTSLLFRGKTGEVRR